MWGGVRVAPLPKAKMTELFAKYRKGQLHQLRRAFFMGSSSSSTSTALSQQYQQYQTEYENNNSSNNNNSTLDITQQQLNARPWALFLNIDNQKHKLSNTDCAVLLKWTRDLLLIETGFSSYENVTTTSSKSSNNNVFGNNNSEVVNKRLEIMQLGVEMFDRMISEDHKVGAVAFYQFLAMCEVAGDLTCASVRFKNLVQRHLQQQQNDQSNSSKKNNQNQNTTQKENMKKMLLSPTTCSWFLRVAYSCPNDAGVEIATASLILDLLLNKNQNENLFSENEDEDNNNVFVAAHDETYPNLENNNNNSSFTFGLSTAILLHLLRPRFRFNTDLQYLVDEIIDDALLQQDGSSLFACNSDHIRFLNGALLKQLHSLTSTTTTNKKKEKRLKITKSLLERIHQHNKRNENGKFLCSGLNWDLGHFPVYSCSSYYSCVPFATTSNSNSSSKTTLSAQTIPFSWTFSKPFPLLNSCLPDFLTRSLEEASLQGDIKKVSQLVSSTPKIILKSISEQNLNQTMTIRTRDVHEMYMSEWNHKFLTESCSTPELMHYLVKTLIEKQSVGVAVEAVAKMILGSTPKNSSSIRNKSFQEDDEQEKQEQEEEENSPSMLPLDITLAILSCAVAKHGNDIKLAASIMAHTTIIRNRRNQAVIDAKRNTGNVDAIPIVKAYWTMNYFNLLFESNAMNSVQFYTLIGLEVGVDLLLEMFREEVAILENFSSFDNNNNSSSFSSTSSPFLQVLEERRRGGIDNNNNSNSKVAQQQYENENEEEEDEEELSSLLFSYPQLHTTLQHCLFHSCATSTNQSEINSSLSFIPENNCQHVFDTICVGNIKNGSSSSASAWSRYTPTHTPLWERFSHVRQFLLKRILEHTQKNKNKNKNNSLMMMKENEKEKEKKKLEVVIVDSSFIESAEQWLTIREQQQQQQQKFQELLNANDNFSSSSSSSASSSICSILIPQCVLEDLDSVASFSSTSFSSSTTTTTTVMNPTISQIDSESLACETEAKRNAISRLTQLSSVVQNNSNQNNSNNNNNTCPVDIVHFSEQLLAVATRPRDYDCDPSITNNNNNTNSKKVKNSSCDSNSIIIDIARMLCLVSSYSSFSQQQQQQQQQQELPLQIKVATNDINLIEQIEEINNKNNNNNFTIGIMTSAPIAVLRNPEEETENVISKQNSQNVLSVLNDSLMNSFDENGISVMENNDNIRMMKKQEEEQQQQLLREQEEQEVLRKQKLKQENNDSPPPEVVGSWQQVLLDDDENESENKNGTTSNNNFGEQEQENNEQNILLQQQFETEKEQEEDLSPILQTAPLSHRSPFQRPEISFSVEFQGRTKKSDLPLLEVDDLDLSPTSTSSSQQQQQLHKNKNSGPSSLEIHEHREQKQASSKSVTRYRPGFALFDESHENRPLTKKEQAEMALGVSRRLRATVPMSMKYRRWKANINDPRNAELVARYQQEKKLKERHFRERETAENKGSDESW